MFDGSQPPSSSMLCHFLYPLCGTTWPYYSNVSIQSFCSSPGYTSQTRIAIKISQFSHSYTSPQIYKFVASPRRCMFCPASFTGLELVCDKHFPALCNTSKELLPYFYITWVAYNALVNVLTVGELHLSALEKFVLGSTSVNVQADQTQKNRAIMTCEEQFCALEYSSEFPKVANIRNILLTNNAKPGYRHRDIVAFTQATLWERNGVLGFAAGQWFIIEGESFYLVRIYGGSGPAMIHRRLHLDGTPSRVTYSEELDKLIVLYTRVVIKRAPSPGRPGQRAIEPTFGFFEMDEEVLRSGPTDPKNDELFVTLPNGESRRANVFAARERKQGEKYLGMTEWLPTDGNNVYHMLVAFVGLFGVLSAPLRMPRSR